MSDSENWLRFAREDLRVAVLAMNDGLYNQVCFHAQQCVEKSLKAWLVHHGKGVPRTHRMADLMPLIASDFIRKLEERLLLLDQFYIPTRYPDALPGMLPAGLPEKQDAQEALDSAGDVLRIIERVLEGETIGNKGIR